MGSRAASVGILLNELNIANCTSDEADVFLESRTSDSDPNRNALVSGNRGHLSNPLHTLTGRSVAQSPRILRRNHDSYNEPNHLP
jgi:hypothetical protein